MQERICSNLGAEENTEMQGDLIGTDISNCGMRATLRDLARFGKMILFDGYFNGHQIIPEHILR
ncbi:hypothetical protein E2R55_03935 [Vibrio vulnificus]|nr:hypothetical protein E2R55_03935 [Vibrio vulnificus]